jgi:hypothetical protein
MKAVLYVTMAVLASFTAGARGQQPKEPAHGAKADMPEAVFKNYEDLKWDKILPDLGASSPLPPLRFSAPLPAPSPTG